MSASSSNLVLNVVGKILSGRETGFFVKVQHDLDDTGGYYIFTSRHSDFKGPETFDAWVESYDDVVAFFQESKWLVEWNLS